MNKSIENLKCESIFNYGKHPFIFSSFSLTVLDIKKIIVSIGIHPITLVITFGLDYSITIEFKIWKSSFTLNIRMWS
tara:strand:- start:58 stop:288 length:231 start_codon:yes stop_codon:yes gene_type:complete